MNDVCTRNPREHERCRRQTQRDSQSHFSSLLGRGARRKRCNRTPGRVVAAGDPRATAAGTQAPGPNAVVRLYRHEAGRRSAAPSRANGYTAARGTAEGVGEAHASVVSLDPAREIRLPRPAIG
jgi:hypothetical protein